MFIENCLQGKYIFQCVDVAANSKSDGRERFTVCRCRIQTWSHHVEQHLWTLYMQFQ